MGSVGCTSSACGLSLQGSADRCQHGFHALHCWATASSLSLLLRELSKNAVSELPQLYQRSVESRNMAQMKAAFSPWREVCECARTFKSKTCAHMCKSASRCACVHIYVCVDLHIYIYICICIYTHMSIHLSIYLSIYLYLSIHLSLHLSIYIYI